MNKVNLRERPEAAIQKQIIAYLRNLEWYVKVTHGNAHQSGFPDLWACHRKFGHRWVECKNPGKYQFTAAQIECFPLFVANGSGIWILTAATKEEYEKLFGPCNWHWYLSTMK